MFESRVERLSAAERVKFMSEFEFQVLIQTRY